MTHNAGGDWPNDISISSKAAVECYFWLRLLYRRTHTRVHLATINAAEIELPEKHVTANTFRLYELQHYILQCGSGDRPSNL